jgi:hypothetical protein
MGICYGLSNACATGCAWAGKTNHRCHIRNRWSWHSVAGMGGNGIWAWRPPCHKRQTYRALTRYAKQTPSVCRLHVTILSAIHVDRFCEMCQGIMNNSVYPRDWDGGTYRTLGEVIPPIQNYILKTDVDHFWDTQTDREGLTAGFERNRVWDYGLDSSRSGW